MCTLMQGKLASAESATSILSASLQAFTLRVRPAVDNVESVVDRTKMSIYKTFARLGLPCPVTGTEGHVGRTAVQAEQQ